MENKDIEVEISGKISLEQFKKIREILEEGGTFKKLKARLSFMYFRNSIPKDLSEIKDDLVDLRFRVTNKEPEIVLKYGSFTGNHARKEITLSLTKENMSNYIEFLNLLGWSRIVVYATRTYTYQYQNIEFALVEIKDYGYNFEAEIITDESHIAEAQEKIREELNRLGLVPFSDEDLTLQCNQINNTKKLQFDLNLNTLVEIKSRFKEFFD